MNLPSLRDLLTQHFDLEELSQLCFDLDIEYENLPGTTRQAKAQSLVEYCLRHNRLPDLSTGCHGLRPTGNWPDAGVLAAAWQMVQQGITAQEGLQGILPDEQIAATLVVLKQKESELLTQLIGSGPSLRVRGRLRWGSEVCL